MKSPNAHYSLTAENWDYVIDHIKSGAVTLTNLSGELTTLSGRVNTLSGIVSSNVTNIASLLTTINSLWKKNGNNIYYTGNVGIGTTPSSAYKLYVSGSGYFSKPLYAPTPTSSSSSTQVATKEYVDSKSTTSQPQYMYIGLNSTNALGASETYSVSDVDFCIINSVTYSTKG
ncbi:MAG: hypothetical protein LBG59_08575 [Candidatus Peribacteria bacterium]|nr:hypothetical protein [Candidatus Peribacteria bacterium]